MILGLRVGGTSAGSKLLVTFGTSVDYPLPVKRFIRLVQTMTSRDTDVVIETIWIHQIYRCVLSGHIL